MNPLEELHKKIDSGIWDVRQKHDLNTAFLETYSQLKTSGFTSLLRQTEVERWVFAFVITPEEGISHQVAGVNRLESGDEIPFVWPDKNDLTPEDLLHIADRFNATQDLYARVEYGLVLYYLNQLKSNQQVLILLNDLHSLSRDYYQKALPEDERNYYFLDLRVTIGHAFQIASKRLNDSKINTLFVNFIHFCTDIHNTWNVNHGSTLRSMIDLTNFAITYKKEFEKQVLLETYLDQNYKAALVLARTYAWGAIYICDISQRLADLIGNTRYDWQTLKAQQFESMVEPAKASGNMAAVDFVEKALTIYKKQGNTLKEQELAHQYDEIRREFRLGEVYSTLPKDESQRIANAVRAQVAQSEAADLVKLLGLTPMFPPLQQIEKMGEESYEQSFIHKFSSLSVIDKVGNTVEVFELEAEKRQHSFWQAYDLTFQVGSQTLIQFFFEAYRAGKLSYEAIIDRLEESWIGQQHNVKYNGYEYSICPLDVVKPGLKLFFDELDRIKTTPEHISSFIAPTDILVTKGEYLLRFLCKLADIPTFTNKQKGEYTVKMEKNIDELLRSLKETPDSPSGFNEADRLFIQYVMSLKMGLNLRNRVAHGLLDANEYTLLNPLLMIVIILKLSFYSFNSLPDDSPQTV